MTFHVPEKHRHEHPLFGMGDHENGLFMIGIPNVKRQALQIIASRGEGWEHVSVVHLSGKKQKTPTWTHMCMAKKIFWDAEDTVIQYHPAAKEYVNFHSHCLHLWRKIGEEHEMPPKWMIA